MDTVGVDADVIRKYVEYQVKQELASSVAEYHQMIKGWDSSGRPSCSEHKVICSNSDLI